MNTFHLSVISPDRVFFSGECVSLSFPTDDGQYTIMAKHDPFISDIITGTIKIKTDKDAEPIWAAVSDGVLRVENGEVFVVVTSAESPDEIDAARAEADIEASEEHIKNRESEREYKLAKYGLARALNRVKVKQQHGRKYGE